VLSGWNASGAAAMSHGTMSHGHLSVGQAPAVATTACVTASTGINSLSVALGSTFGAFLALGVIVAFVLVAKYQYIRRKRKSIQIQLLHRCDDSIDSIPAAVTRDDADDDPRGDPRGGTGTPGGRPGPRSTARSS